MSLQKYSFVFVYFFLKILHRDVLCDEGSSLVFAIDDTGSMENDIKQVIKESNAILKEVLVEKKSEIKDFILVTFNDPGAVLKISTTSPTTFKRYLESIRVYGGYDCPEYSLTGIERALKESRPGSYIFVFTDASAKDYYKFDTIKTLCQKKQSQIIFVLTGDCGNQSFDNYVVYHKIAEISSGQVFRVNKDEVSQVLEPIKQLVRGKHSVVKSTVITKLNEDVPIAFTIDKKVEYALISVSGRKVQLSVEPVDIYKPRLKFERVMWIDNAKVLKVFDLNPGLYFAHVKGSSYITVLIYVRTDFTFEHGFSVLEPKSIGDTAKQPAAGEPQYLSINVTDPEKSVVIQSAVLLDMKDNIISDTLPLRQIGDQFYVTDLMVSPTEMFKIKIQGSIMKTNETISRLSKTAITPRVVPRMPESAPHVEISEGLETYVEYGEGATLSCKVTAHPEPTIAWFTDAGTQLTSESSEIEKPAYISYLKLKHIKKDERYTCKAKNKKGHHESTVGVKVRPVFKIISVPDATTHVKYEDPVKIRCNVKSSLPITIKWFRAGTELSNTTLQSISVDGSKLTVKSMDFGMEGKYTCKVSLNEDPNIKDSFNTNVEMTGLVPPQITLAKSNLDNKRFTAICRVIGNPKPTITWQYEPKGADKFSTIQESGEEFVIPEAKLTHSGNYKCVVESRLGKVEKTLELNVEEAPVITNTLTEYHGVVGDVVLMIPCNVTGYPDPVITWTKENTTAENEFNTEVKGHKLYISSLVPNKTIVFKCEAKNKLGTAVKYFSVEITDYFDNYEDYNKRVYHILEGNSVAIKCAVGNSEANSIRWYMDGIQTKQTGNEFKIAKAYISNDGNYTCRVNTPEGPKSENYKLYVGTLPTFSNGAKEIVNWHDYTTLLNCEVNAKPTEKVEWSHNGNIERSLENKHVVYVNDWGVYTCNASNVHGSIQRTFNVVSSGCYIQKIRDQRMPFMFNSDTLSWPEGISNSDVLVNKHDTINLLCPNGKKSTNAFESFPQKQVIIAAQCDSQDRFVVDGKTYRYKELLCEIPVEPSIKDTHEKCAGPNTEMIQVGFAVKDFVEAYTVCYNVIDNVPLYVNVPKHITKNGRNVNELEFKWNSVSGLDNRQSEFTCGQSQQCCYTKGQVLDVADLPFGPSQAATYLDNLNSVAIWNPCKGDGRTSWQTLVSAVRAESFNYEHWSHTTGASVFVKKNGGFVPRYLWKVITFIDDDIQDAMAIVYVNDESPVETDILCRSPCLIVLPVNTDKYIYCCSLTEFKSAFGIPLKNLRHDSIDFENMY